MDGLFLLLLVALLLFLPLILTTRRQRRQYNEMQQLLSSLQVGERVMTTSGMRATIVALTDDTISLEIAPGVVTTWVKQAVRERIDERTDDVEDEDATVAAEDDTADRR